MNTIAYVSSSPHCLMTVPHPHQHDKRIGCGTYHSITTNGVVYCSECQAYLSRKYPQGWQYYPGDICKHGYYVGGVAEDHMCPHCEGIGDKRIGTMGSIVGTPPHANLMPFKDEVRILRRVLRSIVEVVKVANDPLGLYYGCDAVQLQLRSANNVAARRLEKLFIRLGVFEYDLTAAFQAVVDKEAYYNPRCAPDYDDPRNAPFGGPQPPDAYDEITVYEHFLDILRSKQTREYIMESEPELRGMSFSDLIYHGDGGDGDAYESEDN